MEMGLPGSSYCQDALPRSPGPVGALAFATDPTLPAYRCGGRVMAMRTASETASAGPTPLDARIDALGLRENVRELDELGYTVLQDPVAHALTDRVREAILRLADETEPFSVEI